MKKVGLIVVVKGNMLETYKEQHANEVVNES